MSDADTYFDCEVAALADVRSQAKAAALSIERLARRQRDEQHREYKRRQRHMIHIDEDDDEFCLLDVDPDKLEAALDEIGASGASLSMPETALRTARVFYLDGRKAEAADILYPALRDALGVAV